MTLITFPYSGNRKLCLVGDYSAAVGGSKSEQETRMFSESPSGSRDQFGCILGALAVDTQSEIFNMMKKYSDPLLK